MCQPPVPCTVPPFYLFCTPEGFVAVVTVDLLPVASGACAAVDALLFVLLAAQGEISFLVSPSPDSIALWGRVQLARGPQHPGSDAALTSLSLAAAARAV